MASLLSRLSVRLGLDAIMLCLFVTSLAFRATGRAPHEWIGLCLSILFCIHIVLNRGWYVSLFKGGYSIRRMANTAIILTLMALMAVLCVTGILNSHHIFGFSQYFDGGKIRQIHSLTAYWGLVLIGVHIGLHWEVVSAALRKVFGKSLDCKSVALTLRGLALLIVGYGVWASFDRDMGSKLFLGFSFDFWDSDRPMVLFYTHNLAIIGLYVCIAYYAQKGVKHLTR
jgi:hypothetical protein